MPRPSQGKNRQRIRRELPFQSLQRTVSRASVDIPVSVPTGTLVLAGFAPIVATPILIRPGVRALTLTGFAPAIATPIAVKPGVRALTLTGFAPAVATPMLVRPGVRALTLATFAPAVTLTANLAVKPGTATLVLQGYAPTVQGDKVISTDASGGGTAIRTLHDSERLPGPPLQIYHDLPNDPFPEPPAPLEPVFIALRPDNTDAYIALYESGALTEDEFIVLIAA